MLVLSPSPAYGAASSSVSLGHREACLEQSVLHCEE